MYTALVIFVAIIAVLLILLVLVQNSKGGGLSSEFSGSSSQMFGVKKTTDLLEQLTWGMAGAIMLISLASYVMVGNGSDAANTIDSVNEQRARNAAVPGGQIAPLPAPAGPVAPADTNQ